MCTWGSNVGQDRVSNHGHGKEENKGVGAGKMTEQQRYLPPKLITSVGFP